MRIYKIELLGRNTGSTVIRTVTAQSEEEAQDICLERYPECDVVRIYAKTRRMRF